MAAKDQPVFEIAINHFTFTLYESGQLIVTTPDQNATVLSPNEIHVLFNMLFVNRSVIIAGSRRAQQEREARSNNGRTEWFVIDGRLKETGSESPTFTMTAIDTLTLAALLVAEFENIKKAAQLELVGYSQTEDAYRARRRAEALKADEQFQKELPDVT